MILLCSYGCGQRAKFQFKNGSWCCGESCNSCSGFRERSRKSHSGQIPWNKGLTKETDERVRKYVELGSVSKKGQVPWNKGKTGVYSEETIKSIKETVLRIWKNPNSKYNSEERTNKIRQWMLKNGSRIRKLIRNPSEPELKLRLIVKELHPTSEHTYTILNYDVDVALPEVKVVIEYDGWYHFDTEEHKEYHKNRQERIEQEGWKFIRYTMFDKFPAKEQIEEDIQKILNEREG